MKKLLSVINGALVISLPGWETETEPYELES